MHAIRIHKHLDSETVTLPELKPLVGKNVEIIVLEDFPVRKGAGDLRAFLDSAGKGLLAPDAEEILYKLREASKL